MSHGIPIDLKPERATADMPPPFPYHAFRIGVVIEIVRPGFIRFAIRIDWSLPLRFAATYKFIFIPGATPGTRDL